MLLLHGFLSSKKVKIPTLSQKRDKGGAPSRSTIEMFLVMQDLGSFAFLGCDQRYYGLPATDQQERKHDKIKNDVL